MLSKKIKHTTLVKKKLQKMYYLKRQNSQY